jgi:hypothetical protein
LANTDCCLSVWGIFGAPRRKSKETFGRRHPWKNDFSNTPFATFSISLAAFTFDMNEVNVT